jgi:tetratricopeptide (TPR) repeat protein
MKIKGDALNQDMDNKFLLITILVIIIVNAALYGKTKNFDFVTVDDDRYIYENPLVTKPDSDNIKKILTEPYFSNYQPPVLLFYALEYKFFGANAGGYHIINTILHIINCILVLFLIYYITRDRWISVILALLFSVHPMQVESVAWVSERKGLMCAFFYILSFMSYIRYSRDGGKKFYFLSILSFLLALLSKPIAITFPVILILFDYYEENLTKSKIIEKLPFFILAPTSLFITMNVQRINEFISVDKFKHFSYLFYLVFYNIGFYIGKLIVPVNLSMHYAYPESYSYLSKYFLSGMFVLISLVLYLIYFKRIKREINFGILFFMVSLVPILRIVPVGVTLANDRYMYLPMLGLFFAIVMFINSLILNKPALKKGLIVFASVYLLILGSLAYAQCKVWKNTQTLLENVANNSPDYYNILLVNGNRSLREKNYTSAREFFTLALNEKRSRETALFNMGMISVIEKRPEEVSKYFSRLVNEFPGNEKGNNSTAYMFLGDVSYSNKDYDEAKKRYEYSLKLNKDDHLTHYRYGRVLEKTGDIDQAVKHYRIANELFNDWDLPKKALKRLSQPKTK